MKFKSFIKKINGSKAQLAVLVDPDKFNLNLIHLADKLNVACFLVGGSEIRTGSIHDTIHAIKKISSKPIILFPGDETQLSKSADGLLLLSLLSGRNPEYLIEKHVRAAPLIKKMNLEVLPTAYLLVGQQHQSTTRKVTQTLPLDNNNEIKIVNTCLAAEQLGFKALYLEAGSGAKISIAPALIKKIKKNSSLPLFVGGGIDSAIKTKVMIAAGANVIVVGNALEKNVSLDR